MRERWRVAAAAAAVRECAVECGKCASAASFDAPCHHAYRSRPAARRHAVLFVRPTMRNVPPAVQQFPACLPVITTTRFRFTLYNAVAPARAGICDICRLSDVQRRCRYASSDTICFRDIYWSRHGARRHAYSAPATRRPHAERAARRADRSIWRAHLQEIAAPMRCRECPPYECHRAQIEMRATRPAH